MKKIGSIIVIFVLSSQVFSKWAVVELDELVADTDLIIVGTLNFAVESSEGAGSGYIVVDRLVSSAVPMMQGGTLRAGDYLKIEWLDNWACAAGMHSGRTNKVGIWLLKVDQDGTVSAAYPGRFRPVTDLGEVEDLLRRQKPGSKTSRVDVLIAQLEKPKFAVVVKPSGPEIVVDVSTSNYSLYRGLMAGFLALGLYIILYRSRFRIR